jgi:hypothetical protein
VKPLRAPSGPSKLAALILPGNWVLAPER